MTEPLVPTTRLSSLRSAIGSGDKPLLIAIHDYPDPDAIASALAMQTLAGSWGVQSVIAHGGIIGREENAEMVRTLKIDLKTFSSIGGIENFRGAVLLDTQPAAKNHSLPCGMPVLGVIDHHSLSDEPTRPEAPEAERAGADGATRIIHSHVQTDMGASSTLMFHYLRAADITPDKRLATALFLGIKTDTDSLLRDARPADMEAYTQLLPLVDLQVAALSVHPPRETDYYRFLHAAESGATIYGGTVISFCGDVKTPDMLSTVSDALIPLKGIRYALAAGFHEGRAYLSLRAGANEGDATRVLLHIVEPEGKGGGHNLSAGGFIEMNGAPEKWPDIIRDRILEATGDVPSSREELIP